MSFCTLNNFLLHTNNCLFSTNFIGSEVLQSCFIRCFCHFCMISHSSALMKNKGRVHKCCYVDLILVKLQNPIENDDFFTVNLNSVISWSPWQECEVPKEPKKFNCICSSSKLLLFIFRLLKYNIWANSVASEPNGT